MAAGNNTLFFIINSSALLVIIANFCLTKSAPVWAGHFKLVSEKNIFSASSTGGGFKTRFLSDSARLELATKIDCDQVFWKLLKKAEGE